MKTMQWLSLMALWSRLLCTDAATYSTHLSKQQCCQDGNCAPLISQQSMSFADCKAACPTAVDSQGRPCIAIEFPDNGAVPDDSSVNNCMLMWGCDDQASWNGGSIYLLDPPTPSPTTASPTTASPTVFHCATHGCDDPQLVCDENTGECTRDCGVFHVDDFLRDCSSEWDSVATQGTRISTLEGKVSTIESTLNRMADLSAAHAQLGAFDETGSAGLAHAASLTLDGKDAVIALLVATVAVMSLVMMCLCSRKTCGWSAYQPVAAASGCEVESENEKLC